MVIPALQLRACDSLAVELQKLVQIQGSTQGERVRKKN